MFSLATGVILHYLTGAHTVHDAALFKLIWDFFQAGDVVLGDRAFASYASIVHLKKRGVDVVFRLSAVRPVDFRKGKHLGKNDALFLWLKPLQCTRNMTREELDALPQTLQVRILRFRVAQRGFRTQSVTLVTSLLDPGTHPPQALAQLFYQRWAIELCFRDIKTTLRMEMLSCKSPNMVEKEILMFLMVHNLIRHHLAKRSKIPTQHLPTQFQRSLGPSHQRRSFLCPYPIRLPHFKCHLPLYPRLHRRRYRAPQTRSSRTTLHQAKTQTLPTPHTTSPPHARNPSPR